ncbi:MAG TPA: biotin--[acetyl-CoA-carboxylase] ligase [Actinomycetes bacterium]|jgi:BirA family biotin operon repressor/biotin-[acetyl-CoA-carboxylase] ligase|nr:biotin--[acetyl-CoA-carboxylase] ligase [Actinomycetes bacterium]
MGGPRGYQEAVRRALPAFFTPLETVDRLPTTMARAADLAEAGAPEGATVVAEEQTAGRGRLGRTWVAPPGTSLLVSVVLRPALSSGQTWLVAALAGVALVDAAREILSAGGGRATAGLKWPNDLLLDGRKAAGLLAEAGTGGGRPWVVLGMGVNVGQKASDFPEELGGRATSMTLAAGRRVDRAELLGAWAERFAAGYRDLGEGVVAPILVAYRDRLETLGRRVRAERASGDPLVGTAVDLTGSGSLVVLTGTGARVELAAADVEHLRPALL